MQPKQQRELGFADYVAVAERRWPWIVVATVLVMMAATAVSFVLAPRFTSRALVLVEQQKVPGEYVRSIVNQDLNARLTNMAETIFSRTRLQPLIQRFSLYSDQNISLDEKLEKLRKDIKVTPVKSELAMANSAPGFVVAVDASQPRVAQQVCAEVTSMFLSENLKTREQSAEGTTEFLRSQLEDAKRNLDQQGAALAAFQRKYLGQLPGQEQTNMNVLASLNTRLDAITQAINRTEIDKSYMEAMLAQQAASASGPAVGDALPPQQLETQIEQLQTLLAALEARYTPDHPDVIKTRRELESLQNKMQAAPAPTTADKKPFIEPPEVQQLRAQLHSLEASITGQKAEQERIQQQIKTYQSRVELSPEVQERYRQLTRDSETAQRFYNDLLAKKDQSAMASDLERRQQGEQFTLIDPPSLPERPTFPNKLFFAVGGLAGGLFLGGGLAAWAEFRDQTLRNERDVLHFTGLETLAMIPLVASALPEKSSHKLRGGQSTQLELAEAVAGGRASRRAEGGN